MKRIRNVKYTCYIVGIIFYFIAFLGALVFPSLTYLTYLRIARRGFLLSLLLSVFAIPFLQIGKRYISKSTAQQMATIYFILLSIFLPMFIRSLFDKEHLLFGIYNWIELVVLIAGLLFWCLCLAGTKITLHIQKDKWIQFLILFLVAILAAEQLGVVIKGDSVEYYDKIIRICKGFSFNPNDISLLKSSGHSCYSYSLFSTIGENIIPYFGLGVRIENIIIWMICILFVWRILKELVKNISQPVLAGCVACFALTPLILGNIQEISVELYVLLFFVLFVYFNISKKHILEVFFAICFVFAKEPDIAILAGYYIGIFSKHIISTFFSQKEKTNLFDKDFIISSLSVYIAITTFFLYFVVDVSWGNNASFDYTNYTPGNRFGFNMVYFISKLKQLFVLNFAWIPVLVIALGLLICLYRKTNWNIKEYIPLIFSYVFFLATQLFYLTFVLPRYIMLQYFYLYVVLAFVLHNLDIKRKPLKYAMLGASLLFGVQNFYNIDPISYIAFEILDIGNGYMVFDNPLYIGDKGELITYKDGEIPYIQPYGMTNKQFSYFDKSLEIALAKINYSANDLIVLPQSFDLYPDNFYWGNHLASYYFDTDTKRFMLLINEHVPKYDSAVKVNVIQLGIDSTFETLEDYNRIYYFDFSFSDSIDQTIHFQHHTEKADTIVYRGWKFDIYEMEVGD